MRDAERIQRLRTEGVIDDRQADRLLKALRAIDDELDTVERSTDALLETSVFPASTPNPVDPRARIEPGEEVPRRWLRIDALMAELDIEGDDDANEPILNLQRGTANLKPTPSGWHLRQTGNRDDERWDRLLGNLVPIKARIRVPRQLGVHLDVKFADVTIRNVPAIRGRIYAGDLDATAVRAVDVRVHAGDVDLGLDPSPGQHHARVDAGELTIHVNEDANVAIDGHVSVGEATGPAPLVAHRSDVVNVDLKGTFGTGKAHLHANVGAGELTIQRGARRGE